MRLGAVRIVIGLMLLASFSMLAVAAGLDKKQTQYSEWDKAYYLTSEQLEFIRPGLNFTIESIVIPADTRKPKVTYSIKDDRGQPLDRDGILTPGSVSASFVLGRINAGDTQYTSYTVRTQTSPITRVSAVQPSADSGGSTKMISLGLYEYTFGTTLPADYPRNVTTTLGIYSTRDLRPWGMTRHVVNPILNFRPDGGTVTTVRDVARTATCNECHNPLALHGGSRQKMELCIMCHTSNVIDPDTGESVDMKIMAHKIHRGEFLPSVQAGRAYRIIGFGQSVHDYSDVVFPQDIRNCTKCHKTATQGNNWFTQPTRDTCGSCHDLINWDTGQGHVGGRQVSDRFCANCHFPEGELEYDASIRGAHLDPLDSRQLVNPRFEIVSISNALPGRNPRIEFRIRDKNGADIAPSRMSRLAATIAGPTADYSWQRSETVSNPQSSAGVIVWNFTNTLPANATGTYTFGLEGYINATLNPGTSKAFTFRDRANVVFQNAAVTGTLTPRRAVVSDAKCNACHKKLILHGNNRDNPMYCITCHNPTQTDVARRPAAQAPAESVDMRVMIHKIHTGYELNREYTAYGFGNVPHDYTHVHYPGDRRDCLQCHVAGSFDPPLREGLLSVVTPRDFFTPQPPATAACLGCHDSRTAAAHAFVNIAPFGESCGACHGAGRTYSVAASHAR